MRRLLLLATLVFACTGTQPPGVAGPAGEMGAMGPQGPAGPRGSLLNVVNVEDYADVGAAVASIGSASRTLAIASQQVVGANLTIPANVTLWFTGAGLLDVSQGATLTVLGPMIAPPRQIFSRTSVAQFFTGLATTVTSVVYPEWWGAVRDGITDDSGAIQSAIASLPPQFGSGGTVALSAGTYKCNIVLGMRTRIVGSGRGTTVLVPAIDDAVIKTATDRSTVDIAVRHLTIKGNTAFASDDGIVLKTTKAGAFVDQIEIDDVQIARCRYGLVSYGESAAGPFVQRLHVNNVDIGGNARSGLFIDGTAFESSVTNSFITANGDTVYPNVHLHADPTAIPPRSGVHRFLFSNVAFNAFNNLSKGVAAPAVVVEHGQQVTVRGCDFEQADPFLYLKGSLTRNVTVEGSNFGSNFAVDKAIIVDAASGLSIRNNSFASNVGINYGIFSASYISAIQGLDIGPNNFMPTTTPVSIPKAIGVSTGAITAYREVIELANIVPGAVLDNILDDNGGTTKLMDGQHLTLLLATPSTSNVVLGSAGNIVTPVTRTLATRAARITLMWDRMLGKWVEVSFAG